jgi:Ser/Thr protein kinase RdoA (MazF antagonist)
MSNLISQTAVETNEGKLFEQVELSPELIQEVLDQLMLTAQSAITVPEEGRIASNFCVETAERGSILIRFYPVDCETKNESGSVHFEVESLKHLADKGISVPAPLLFKSGDYLLKLGQSHVFAYVLVTGRNLRQEELSIGIAEKCGRLLSHFIQVSQEFHPKDPSSAPKGDLQHIIKICSNIQETYPELKDSSELAAMAQEVQNPHLQHRLAQTPMGVVHADFFFENILIDEPTETLSLIDFGDAYYGHVIMDIVIGAMEFCVKEDKSWDLDMFRAFLKPNISWLSQHNIDWELFHFLLLANCLRFAVYTIPFTCDDQLSVNENPYVFRFQLLKTPSFIKEIKAAYDRLFS